MPSRAAKPAVLSCGVLVMNPAGELLLGHATGTPRWDIPKGLAEPGESPREAALRELQEEVGLQVDADALHEVGRFRYRPGKELHLFASLLPRIDPAGCCCTSTFVDPWGRTRQEFDAFEWTTFAKIPERCGRSLAQLLGSAISLPALLASLQQA